MPTHAQVVVEARRLLGVPYQHQASNHRVAVDCIGNVACVARALGIPEADAWERDARRRAYSWQPDPEMATKVEAEYLDRIPLRSALPGDLLRLRMGRVPHYAFLSGVDSIIHAYASAGKVVENRIDVRWRRRILYALRFKGM